ncbi:MAG: polysaccharide deacetylase family protein [Flavobacteriales bacterium]|nr:polysaccharide deacetylase family protein [Flavobacteriales bacterium]
MFIKTPSLTKYLFPSLVWKKNTDQKKIWITFDDGPDEKVTPYLIDVLEKFGIKATFFIIGNQAKKYPELVKLIISNGHKIGNHSFSHLNGFSTNNNKYLEDVEQAKKYIDSDIFRPPYGKITPFQIKKLKKDFKIIMWDIMSWDFKENIYPNKIYKNVIDNVENGSIILFHNNLKSYNNLKNSLEIILEKLKDKGYQFSTTW